MRKLIVGSLAVLCSAWSSIVFAQVLEIAPSGTMTLHDRPAVYGSNGSTPIEPAAPAVRQNAAPRRRSVAVHAPGLALTAAADAAELSPALVEAVAWAESRLRPGLISRAGAIGEMQLMPSTARALGVDPRDSVQNYRGGAAYLRQLLARYDGDIVRAIAAYDAGPRAVDRYAGVPPFAETRAYVAAILERLSLGAGDLVTR